MRYLNKSYETYFCIDSCGGVYDALLRIDSALKTMGLELVLLHTGTDAYEGTILALEENKEIDK